MSNKWLENLQKADHPLPAAPLPEPAAKIDMFSDLFRIDGADIPVAKASKAYEDGVSEAPPDAVDVLLKSEERLRFRIGKPFPDEPEPENLYAFHEQPVKGFVTEDVAKILGIGDISEETLRK
jgi:hypothetical protein